MSDLETRIAEVLAAHRGDRTQGHWWICCSCGFDVPIEGNFNTYEAQFNAHVAAALAPVIAEAKVEALREASAAAYKDKRIQGLQRTIIGIWTNNRADELEQP